MKVFASTTAIFVTISAVATGISACETSPYASCGNTQGTTCCPQDQYCQPWNSGYYQCINFPTQCSEQYTDTDFFGDDLMTIYGIQPSDCCEKCAQTQDCGAYTFVNDNPGQPACYLKKGMGQKQEKKGAMSGVVNGKTPVPPTVAPTVSPTPTPTPAPTTEAPPPSCPTPSYGACGSDSSQVACCPQGEYCQPWNPGFYQCITTPAQCSKQFTNVDFYGNDLKTVYGLQPSDCCAECAKTPGCKAYTFVNGNPGRPACYLKSVADGNKQEKKGVVSGILN